MLGRIRNTQRAADQFSGTIHHKKHVAWRTLIWNSFYWVCRQNLKKILKKFWRKSWWKMAENGKWTKMAFWGVAYTTNQAESVHSKWVSAPPPVTRTLLYNKIACGTNLKSHGPEHERPSAIPQRSFVSYSQPTSDLDFMVSCTNRFFLGIEQWLNWSVVKH